MYTYIEVLDPHPNVGKYSIHGLFGICMPAKHGTNRVGLPVDPIAVALSYSCRLYSCSPPHPILACAIFVLDSLNKRNIEKQEATSRRGNSEPNDMWIQASLGLAFGHLTG